MDETTKRRHAHRRGWYSEGDGGLPDMDYTLYLAGDEVELCWQCEIDGGTIGDALTMSVVDLKRFIQAGQQLLKATGNDTPLPIERPDTDNI